jgi:DNA-binding CsgD family transcriptional regulator
MRSIGGSLPEWDDPDRRDDALDRIAAMVAVGKEMSDEQLEEFFRETQPKRLEPSPGELNALIYSSQGLSAKEIAGELGLSRETVRTQLLIARRKLAAKNTTHACCIAIRLGLIP